MEMPDLLRDRAEKLRRKFNMLLTMLSTDSMHCYSYYKKDQIECKNKVWKAYRLQNGNIIFQ